MVKSLKPVNGMFETAAMTISNLLGVPETCRHQNITIIGAFLLACGLFSLGLISIFCPNGASQLYGLKEDPHGWIAAAGVRDLGISFSIFAMLHMSPEGMSALVLGVFFIPWGDALITMFYGDGLTAAFPHFFGCFAVGTLLFLSFHPICTHDRLSTDIPTCQNK